MNRNIREREREKVLYSTSLYANFYRVKKSE